MSIIPTITEQDIRTFVGEQNFLKGQQYVQDRAIVDAARQGMTLKAYCYGSLPDPYRVQVTFDATSISAAICSCPVGTPASYGNRCCKHAAGLLLTWHKKPEIFTDMDDLDTTLERRDKAELIVLIKQLLSKHPEFAWHLTMPPPTSKRKTPVNLETYHEQVVAAFRYSGHEWHAADKVSDELFGIKHIGDDFAKQHDYIAAATIYTEVVMGVVRNIGGYHDENGSLSHVVSMCIDAINELLQSGQCDSMTRERMLQALFTAWITSDLGLRDQVPAVLVKQATVEERPIIAGWVYNALAQIEGTGWFAERYRQKYGAFLLGLAGETVTNEAFLQICRDTDRFADAVERLLTLERIDEAATEAGRASDRTLFDLIDLFIKHGHDDVAEHVMQERSQQSKNTHVLDWLKTRYLARNEYALALELAKAIFCIQPTLQGYQEIRQLAGHLDCWKAVRVELLVRLDKSRDGVLLTYIALDERDIERALELVKFKAHVRYIRRNGDHKIYTYDYDYQDVVFDVAQVAEEMRPCAAIDIYVDHVEYIIDQRERKKYQLACSYLAKVRTLYEKLGDSEGWTNYIADLRNRTKTLKTLQNEIRE